MQVEGGLQYADMSLHPNEYHLSPAQACHLVEKSVGTTIGKCDFSYARVELGSTSVMAGCVSPKLCGYCSVFSTGMSSRPAVFASI